ncbi:MAG: DarT ssDNA thymidine ADP-ribosyltransferase family protein [Acidobacteria bacterium]|nr:DarT ssDNA thymidine ADP-ribosyltransferase family protein [Acidobacteriota bacterium]
MDPFIRYHVSHFYHFCDRRNLPLIRELRGLLSLEQLEARNIEIPAPGGNDWSHDADRNKGLHRYVHLCLRNNHPMEFVARQEGRIVDTVFLQVSSEVLQLDGVMYASGVSNRADVPIRTIDEARGLIDFEVAYTRTDWTDPAIKRRLDNCEKCEILVPDFIPIELIRNIADG